MEIWKDVDLYEQGLKDFESLSPAQQDWFLVKHFDIHYEMEGGLLSHAEDMAQLHLLKDTLRRLGDIVSAGILSKLEHTRESEGKEIENLSRSYTSEGMSAGTCLSGAWQNWESGSMRTRSEDQQRLEAGAMSPAISLQLLVLQSNTAQIREVRTPAGYEACEQKSSSGSLASAGKRIIEIGAPVWRPDLSVVLCRVIAGGESNSQDLRRHGLALPVRARPRIRQRSDRPCRWILG